MDGRHNGALFGEDIGCKREPPRPVFEIAKCDLKPGEFLSSDRNAKRRTALPEDVRERSLSPPTTRCTDCALRRKLQNSPDWCMM